MKGPISFIAVSLHSFLVKQYQEELDWCGWIHHSFDFSIPPNGEWQQFVNPQTRSTFVGLGNHQIHCPYDVSQAMHSKNEFSCSVSNQICQQTSSECPSSNSPHKRHYDVAQFQMHPHRSFPACTKFLLDRGPCHLIILMRFRHNYYSWERISSTDFPTAMKSIIHTCWMIHWT